MMSIVPLEQFIWHIQGEDLDNWGGEILEESATLLPCKVKYSNQRFYLRGAQGYEEEQTCYILLQGKVKVDMTDTFKFQFPDGDFIDYKPQSLNYIFDMSGNIYLTKVWVK